MIRFANEIMLQFLWAVPILIMASWVEYNWRIKAMKRWADRSMWDHALPHRAPLTIFFKRVMLSFAIGFLIIGLAGPQVGTKEIEVKREGTDIVLAIDVSKSMLAADISPSRLVKAKHEVGRLLKRLRGDRVALVPFANVAFIQVPLTLDYSAVMTSVFALEPQILPYPGTSIGAAIERGRQAFKIDSKAEKILILITDSEDHDSEPVVQAEEAAKEGVRIFTIGMATPQGAPIPELNERGQITDYKTHNNTTVVSRLNESLLKEISQITGGEFYPATKTGREFDKVYEKIAGMDKEEFEAKQYTDYEDRFQWLLAMSFLLIALEEFIPSGKRRKRKV